MPTTAPQNEPDWAGTNVDIDGLPECDPNADQTKVETESRHEVSLVNNTSGTLQFKVGYSHRLRCLDSHGNENCAWNDTREENVDVPGGETWNEARVQQERPNLNPVRELSVNLLEDHFYILECYTRAYLTDKKKYRGYSTLKKTATADCQT